MTHKLFDGAAGVGSAIQILDGGRGLQPKSRVIGQQDADSIDSQRGGTVVRQVECNASAIQCSVQRLTQVGNSITFGRQREHPRELPAAMKLDDDRRDGRHDIGNVFAALRGFGQSDIERQSQRRSDRHARDATSELGRVRPASADTRRNNHGAIGFEPPNRLDRGCDAISIRVAPCVVQQRRAVVSYRPHRDAMNLEDVSQLAEHLTVILGGRDRCSCQRLGVLKQSIDAHRQRGGTGRGFGMTGTGHGVCQVLNFKGLRVRPRTVNRLQNGCERKPRIRRPRRFLPDEPPIEIHSSFRSFTAQPDLPASADSRHLRIVVPRRIRRFSPILKVCQPIRRR